jgi:putative ABC transport system permease protein
MLLLNSVRAHLREMDKDQPLGRPALMRDAIETQTVQPRFTMALFSFFAILGLALAAVGIYSVLSFLVATRTHEIGVRMALGAQWSDVLSLILSSGGKLVLGGMVAGLGLALVATRFLKSQLYEVSSSDPVSYFGVLLVLGTVGLLACYIPARRAAQVDPMRALRHE